VCSAPCVLHPSAFELTRLRAARDFEDGGYLIIEDRKLNFAFADFRLQTSDLWLLFFTALNCFNVLNDLNSLSLTEAP